MLEPATLEQLNKNDFAYQKTFITTFSEEFLLGIYKRLELMEIEGKHFQIFKSPMPVDQRPRSDKVCPMQLGHMEKQAHPDHKDLIKLLRTMANLPFELNMKYQTDMQV